MQHLSTCIFSDLKKGILFKSRNNNLTNVVQREVKFISIKKIDLSW